MFANLKMWFNSAGLPAKSPVSRARTVTSFPLVWAPAESLKVRLIEQGMSEAMAQGNVDTWTAYSQGLDTAEPRTPESTTPTSFRQWCEEVLNPRLRRLTALEQWGMDKTASGPYNRFVAAR